MSEKRLRSTDIINDGIQSACTGSNKLVFGLTGFKQTHKRIVITNEVIRYRIAKPNSQNSEFVHVIYFSPFRIVPLSNKSKLKIVKISSLQI